MNETFAVEKNERIENRSEHIANLGFGERSLGEDLRKILLGILHHNVEAVPVLEPPAACLEAAEQIRMFKLLDAAPERELKIGIRTRGNEFDGRSLRLRIVKLREENGGIVGASKILPKPESIVNHLTFGLRPDIAHGASPTASTCEPADADTSNSVARDRRKSTVASKAGLERLELRFAVARGPGARHPHSGTKRAGKGEAFLSLSHRDRLIFVRHRSFDPPFLSSVFKISFQLWTSIH